MYVVLASTICLILLIVKPKLTWPGLVIVALGVPVLYLFGSRFKKYTD
jgi:APA family basic amino acid/polyamine antiporter